MSFKAFSSRASTSAIMGSLPTNSGVMPYLIISVGSAFRETSASVEVASTSSVIKPILLLGRAIAFFLFSLICSFNPSKAPLHINNTFEVSKGILPALGCFLCPSGIPITLPSSILSNAC